MPIHTVALPNGGIGWQWGTHGAKYRDREGAARQAKAAAANGADTRVARDSNIRALVKNLLAFFAEEADEPEHADQAGESVRAAGVAVRAPDGALLLVRRKGGDHAGEWAFPGGVAEGEEDPEATARRELAEETGYTASAIEPAYATHVDGVDFATFVHQAPEKFEPRLNDEGAEHAWAMPDALPKPLHPGVATAMATDPPVSEAQRRAMFAAASGHSKLGIPKKVGEEFVGKAQDALAFDYASARNYDKDGRLHVAVTNISKAAINPYRGKEIPGWRELGLEPERVYNLLRHPDELAKAAPTFNSLPLLSEHVSVTADEHPKELVVGSLGTDAEFALPYLRNSLVVWPKSAIELIESDEQKELSSAYRYRADMTPGSYDGQPYDGVMRDIVGNHVALVKEGRAGADVVVGDSAIDPATTLKENHMPKQTKTRLGVYIHGGLAAFVKKPSAELSLALDAALRDVTAKTWGADKPKIKTAIAAIKGIAQDADLEKMHGFIDRLDDRASDDLEEDPNKAASDETEEEKKARAAKEAADKKARDDWEASAEYKGAKDAFDKRIKGDAAEPPDFEGRPKVTKAAMDAAIAEAVVKATKDGAEAATKLQREIRDAERFVQPWVGTLQVAFDSAEGVYRRTLDMLSVKHVDVHPSALRTIVELHPKPGAKPERKQRGDMATDAASAKSFAEQFPGAARIAVLN